MTERLAVTVGDLLPDLGGAAVIAGAAGLQRVVKAVNILDGPDGMDRLREGDLAFALLPPDSGILARLVPQFHRTGVAAAVLRPQGTRAGPAPPSPVALNRADQLGFPLLEVSPETSYAELLATVTARLLQHEALLLRRRDQIHRALTRAAVEGSGADGLAAALAEMVGNPVVLLDPMTRPVAVATAQTGLPCVDMARAEARSGHYLMAPGDTLHRRETVTHRGQDHARIVTPVLVGGQRYGYITVLEARRPVADADLVAVGCAAAVAALVLVQLPAAAALERGHVSRFIADLFAREIEAEELLLERGQSLGWDLNRPLAVLVMDLAETEPPAAGKGARPFMDLLVNDLAADLNLPLLVGTAGSLPAALLAPRAGLQAGEAKKEARALAETLQSRTHRHARQVKLSVGIGTVHQGVLGVRRSFYEARRALYIGRRIWGPGCIAHIEDLGVLQMLTSLRHSEEMEHLIGQILPLQKYDQEHRTDLVQTLALYFECKGNVRRVSERLYTHYNTVLYRLERIQQITGCNLEDPYHRLNLQVALEALKLLGR